MTSDGGGDVKGIDIIVKKKPGGHMTTLHLADTGNGIFRVTHVGGGEVADHHRLRQIGGLVGALLTGDIAASSVLILPTVKPDGQTAKTTAILKSISNIKNSF